MAAEAGLKSTMSISVADEVVDVVILARPHTVPYSVVVDAVENQRGVRTRVLLHTGWPERTDTNRWITIARARNEMKQRTKGQWVMFLDDDVVLDPWCIANLLRSLKRGPSLGAIAADYLGESRSIHWDGHVAMGACLFRRNALDAIHFRSTPAKCECWCCCYDLRSLGIGITYCDQANARHLKSAGRTDSDSHDNHDGTSDGCILAAFDRRDTQKFERQFIRSLRTSGNSTPVFAAVYGLYPSELRRLEKLSNVFIFPSPANRTMAPIRRLFDFANIASQLPSNTPVAYWDVADVVFQTNLKPLWREIRQNAGKIGAVVEPKSYPENEIIIPWTFSIIDPYYRQQTFDLLQRSPFLNSGFAAGTATSMIGYFLQAQRMRFGPELSGSTDWGDQMCLNRYCHLDPQRWWAMNEGWNYCIHDRPVGEIWVTPQGEVMSNRIGRVPIAHGNARSLRQLSLFVPAPPTPAM
jgi:hypothetical protein